jgi:hypothetical protein
MKKSTIKNLSNVFFFTLLLNTYVVTDSIALTPPLVYDVENTGDTFPKPVRPPFDSLPGIDPLPDPFKWSIDTGRSTNFSDWSHRRAEIAELFQQYEIGPKPPRPDSITASYSKGTHTLTVIITKNGQTLTLTCNITLPSGAGPFPAIIGVNAGTGSLPSDIFTGNNIATIAYMINQVVTYNSKSTSDPYFKLYPDLFYSGEYAPWAWGVSRIIDGLELVQDSLPIDLKHLGVTGCSYAGKLALFAGALDERIALTIAQESGGGGAAAWRVSQTLGGVETLGATSSQWFMGSMFQFSNANLPKLPEDHHELMAIVAPRALFVIGNPDYVWLADPSGYVSCKAAQKVYETFGIGDRFGFSIVGGHVHCNMPASERPELLAFVQKFLLDSTNANTNIRTNPYPYIDYNHWTEWWGSGKPYFPKRDTGGSESVWLEAECATVGLNWNITKVSGSSNGYFISPKNGLNSTSVAPTDTASTVYFTFDVNKDTTFYVFGRLYCPANHDSYWMKMDDGPFEVSNSGLTTTTWDWKTIKSYNLTAGEHTLAIAYRVDGNRIDKLCISSNIYYPSQYGDTAQNICVPVIHTGVKLLQTSGGYALGQNQPNPFNDVTSISFEIPNNSYVSLKVYNVLGAEIAELAGKKYSKGRHTVEFNSKNISNGIYYYTIKADKFTASKNMIIQNKY